MHLITFSDQVEVLQALRRLTGRYPVAITQATSLGHRDRAGLSPYRRVAVFVRICGPSVTGLVHADPVRLSGSHRPARATAGVCAAPTARPE